METQNRDNSESHIDAVDAESRFAIKQKGKWYRSPFFAASIVGLANFMAPGLWNALNSLGGGGLDTPYLVNASNALTFGLMFVTSLLGSAVLRVIGLRNTLILGTMGYPPYAAALYCYNRFGVHWFVIFGSALCGLTAGFFWMAEAVVILSYPEKYNKGKFLGLWLSFRVLGEIVGGAINLGLSAQRNTSGKISYKVYYIFIALQAVGPFVAALLTPPRKVQRSDGKPVVLYADSILTEIKETLSFFLRKDYLLLVPLIWQTAFPAPLTSTYNAQYFSVRARALGSLLGAVTAIIAGNLLGLFLDAPKVQNKVKARAAFFVILTLQGAWWVWSTVNQQEYQNNHPTFDWSDAGFGRAFALYIFLTIGYQLNMLYLYYVIGNLAQTPQEVIRLSSLLRGTESMASTVSYGLNSVEALTTIGNSAINFGLWGSALIPAWFMIKKIGVPGGYGSEQHAFAIAEEGDADEEKESVEKSDETAFE